MMRIRGLLLAAIVFFALAGVLYWSDHHKPAAEANTSAASPAILKLDQGSITRVELKKPDTPAIVLDKNGSGSWQITDPKPLPADQDTVSGVVRSLSSLDSQRVVEDKASDLKRYGLDPAAFQANVTEKGNKSQQVLFGDTTPTGNSVYAQLAGDPRVFTVATYVKGEIDKGVDDLRDKQLVTISPDKVSQIELTGKNGTIEFGRSKDEWQILKPKPMRADSTEVGELARQLTEARMNLTGPDASEKAADSGFAHGTPLVTAKITADSGTQELQIHKDKDNYYAKSSVVPGAYQINSDLPKALDKKVDDFRNKKVFDFGYNQPNKIELHDGSKAYYLVRSGDDWWQNGKKMDPASTDQLLGSLRDLSADKFPDSGFANPQIQATVTWDDSKRVDKVEIAKSGDGYIAKRENDPTLYHLDASPVDELQKAADGLKQAPAGTK